ncbi:MAG: GNAT family N-acetyltransferase [Cyanobacteria bacterium P01_F01_bin.42]
MASTAQQSELLIRAVQYRDFEAAQSLLGDVDIGIEYSTLLSVPGQTQSLRQSPAERLRLLALRSTVKNYVAIRQSEVLGVIQVSPCNRAQTTWKINAIAVRPGHSFVDIGSALLRYCLQSVYEAHTWLVELDVNRNDLIGIYRSSGFQPIAHATHWSIEPANLAGLAQQSSSLSPLIAINNADAALLYQLDTVAMPPFVRQVLDRRVQDFTKDMATRAWSRINQALASQKTFNGYIFEPQRKVAIGCFELCLCRNSSAPHIGQMTVHPAYTWLYPKLLSHMAELTQTVPAASLYLTSADYQSEREDYLSEIQVDRVGHSLMMSRSVWHKLREMPRRHALETSPLAEVLQGLQPKQTPIPGRFDGTQL